MADHNTSKAKKQSFFREYLLYKLRSLQGFSITFAVMNLAVTAVLALTVLVLCTEYKNEALDIGNSHYLFSIFSYYVMGIMFLTFIAENILIMIMAAINMKICHNRSAMDTIGGLPLTVNQRFFGDFLSGAISFSGTFFIGCIPAYIMMAVIQFGVAPEYQAAQIANGSSYIYLMPRFEDNFLLVGSLAMLTMLLCLAASYTIACFVTSCSGKLNTSIIFSFGLAVTLPIIAASYGKFVVDSSIGVYDDAYVNVLGMLPPVGTIVHLFILFTNSLLSGYLFAAASPGVIVMLAIVILPAVGAYLISKKRNAESVDKPFIYRSIYTVATFLLSVTSCGLMLSTRKFPSFVLIALIFTVTACVFIEYSGSHLKRTFWKGLVRFAVSAAACALFAVIARNTNGFNIGKKLPDENKIQDITIAGSCLSDAGHNTQNYDEPAVISAIYSEHKKIIENLDEFLPVSSAKIWDPRKSLRIVYHMKDESYIERLYFSSSEKSNEIIENICTELLSKPEIYNRTSIGVLDMPCRSISYHCNRNAGMDSQTFMVKPSAQSEFIECLKSDLLNRPRVDDPASETVGQYIIYRYTDEYGNSRESDINLLKADEKTLAFLSNPDNLSDEIRVIVDEYSFFHVQYYADGNSSESTLTLSVGFKADTPAKRELVSYFETEYSVTGDYSDKFIIYSEGNTIKVKAENESAALTVLMDIIKEQALGGNIS